MNAASKRQLSELSRDSPISAVDLFCGAGGLTHGLLKSGVRVVAGVDIDDQCRFAYERNNPGVTFHSWDVGRKTYASIDRLFGSCEVRLLAGCAPCQPFSKLTNGIQEHRSWDLLNHFSRFVSRIQPELVTMENVPELADRGRVVFDRFVRTLERLHYSVDWRVVNCLEYGVPQSRKRLVLLASQLGDISVPDGHTKTAGRWKTVRQTIGRLPSVESGQQHHSDALHVASRLTELNLRRIKATPHDGGCRRDWPDELILDCHRKKTGERYQSIYGRMWWDRPAPTMTTLCNGIGNGRFGHPEQDRAITLREAALIQSFPKSYAFWPDGEVVNRKAVGRMIGNAVPPRLARALGKAMLKHLASHS